jgi:hypothetical protein
MFGTMKFSTRAILCASVAAACLAAAPIAGHAAGEGQGKGAAAHGQGGGHGAAAGGEERGKGARSLGGLFRDITGEEDDGGEDSDRPDWAGAPGGGSAGMGGGKPTTAGAKKGDLFGDLWVILRDEDGVPILSDAGFVQPIAADGSLIPLDEEGAPIDDTLTQEVELGRLNVGRAPTKVLDRRADEVVTLLSSATALSLDPAGRLTVTTVDADGVTTIKTIDAPLENLAIYVALLTDGSIPGLTPETLVGTDFDFMVDGEYTIEDLAASAAFLAAATDKTSPFSADEIAYIDAFLGINLTKDDDVSYSVIDYSDFTYDRSDTFADAEATVLIQQDDGTWAPETINVYDEIFSSVDVTVSGTLDAYVQAAEDARTVVEYIHEYAVPVDQTASN